MQVPSSGAAAVPAPWVLMPRPNPQASLRLFCFPYAGVGPSIYRPWLTALPSHVEARLIQLPGREGRWREPALTSIPEIADRVARAIVPHLQPPFVFYGHSLGALLSFEVARRLRAAGHPMPRQLFVGAHRGPQMPNPHSPIAHLSDDAFVAEVRKRYDGIPQAVLDNRELLELMLPCLRADFTAFETYQYRAEPPLEMPISAFGGDQDGYVRSHEIAGWREQTTGRFRVRVIPGNHFFMQTGRDEVIAALVDDLSAAPAAVVAG
ncbi:MAG TPA: alpha/beta fold hydrolase [Vicinamibacterales bacterium]|nr:alpha/beta fold hydrolase [Vicinamibacterales bacterium]